MLFDAFLRGWRASQVRVGTIWQGGQHATGATESGLSEYVTPLLQPDRGNMGRPAIRRRREGGVRPADQKAGSV